MPRGGSSADDLVKQILARLEAGAAKSAPKKAASGSGRRGVKAAKSAAQPAVKMSKAERSAANRAAHAKKQAELNAERAKAAPAKKQARTAENRAKGIARGNRKADEAYGYREQLKRNKSSLWWNKQVEGLNAAIDQNARISVRGSQARRNSLKKEWDDIVKYAKENGYQLSLSDAKAMAGAHRKIALGKQAGAERRLKGLIAQTEGKTEREIVDMGARRARAQEVKTGKKLTGKTPAWLKGQKNDTQKRLTKLWNEERYDKLAKKADSKMGNSRGPQGPKKPKKIVETESSKRLRAQQDANAKKSVVDPRVAKMSPAQRKKFLAAENKKWKEIKNRKINQRGMSDKDAKDKLANLGERGFASDKRKLGPYPTTDRYGRYSGKR